MVRSLRITTNIRSRVNIRWPRVGGLLVIIMAVSLISAKLLPAVDATAGDLDPSFGAGGKVEGGPNIDAIAIQADGKLLALGRSQNANCQLSRFNPDGSLDSNFGMGRPGGNGLRERFRGRHHRRDHFIINGLGIAMA